MFRIDFKDNFVLYQLIAGVTAVALILIGCIVVLAPFFPAMLLATIFTLATWPAFVWLHNRLKNRTTLAASLMAVLLACCFVVPLIIIGTSIADNYERVYAATLAFLKSDPQIIAARLQSLSFGGDMLKRIWLAFMSDREHMLEQLQQYSGKMTQGLLKVAATFGVGLFDVTVGVIISFFLFRHGTATAGRVSALIEKFGGEEGRRLLNICKNTLIGVVYGLLGTALAQGAFAALGFWIANVPGAPFLGLMTFFVSLVPIGPPLIWIPAALWLASEEQTFWAVFLAIWGAVVIGSIDNVMKPYFISRGSNLPLLLVLFGIIGGVLAFGFIGVFIGPTLLALAYSLLLEWSTVRKIVSDHPAPQGGKKKRGSHH